MPKDNRTSWKYRLRKLVVRSCGLSQPLPREPPYAKSQNTNAARYLVLEDLKGTDLFKIVYEIGEIAKRMIDE